MRDELFREGPLSRPRRAALLCALATAALGCASKGGKQAPITVAIAPLESAGVVEGVSSAGPRRGAPAPPIPWEKSEVDAVARARAKHLPLLIFVCADWDAAGREMERAIWSDVRVRGHAQGFVALRLDLSGDDVNNELYAQRYEVKGMPTTIVIDAHGARVATILGFTTSDALIEALDKARE